MENKDCIIKIASLNIQGQTGLNNQKQKQLEHFIKTHKIDILNCQEINIDEESFSDCNYISSSYTVVENNAHNRYGTAMFISNNLDFENIKKDTEGRVISVDIGKSTFCNVYAHSGNDRIMRTAR